MPKIQRYQRQETVTSQAPSAMANVGAAGIVGNAIAGVGNALGDIAQRQAEMKKEDQYFATQSIGNTANDYALEFETEFKAKQEKDAYNSGAAVDDWMVKTTDKLLDIPDEKVRFQVNDHIQALGLKLKDRLATHEAQQRKVVAVNTLRGTLESASKAAYQGSGTLADNLAIINAAVANDPTMGESEKENALLAYQSGVAESYLDGMVNRNPQAAGELVKSGMFNEYLKKEQLEKFDKQIKAGATFQVGLATANRLLDDNPDATTDQLLTILRKDPTVDKDSFAFAEGQIKTAVAAREQSKKLEIDRLESSVTAPLAKKIAGGGTPTLADLKNSADSQALLKADPEKYQKIAEHIIALNDRATDRSRMKEEHNTRQSLLDGERQLKGKQKSNFADLWGDMEALRKTDLGYMVVAEDLTPEQATKLEARKTNANKDTLLSQTEEIKKVLASAKIKEKTPNYDEAIQYIETRVGGRELKSSEVVEIAREAVYKSNTGWFDTVTDKPAYKMKISDVPADDKRKITDALKSRRMPVTDESIISTYIGKQRKGK